MARFAGMSGISAAERGETAATIDQGDIRPLG
jgi:hypothetical protein